MNSKRLFIVVLFLFCQSAVWAQFMYTSPISTAFDVVIGIQGNGVSILTPIGQIQPGCASFVNNGISEIPYANGVIMSTGEINQNPLNDSASFTNSTDFGLPGDPMLNAEIVPFLTYDNQYVEFDFVAVSDTVIIEAIFASEEYNNKVNQQTADIFRFFLSGPGYSPNTIVSTIPGTQTPVGINTINNGQSTGTSTGPCNNCSLFIDNVGTGAVDLAFDGYTTPLIFKFRVNVCEQYHMKISLADVFNGLDDSFLLLKGGGMRTSGQVAIYADGVPVLPNDTVYICQGGTTTLSVPPGNAYMWSTGDTTQSILVNQPGIFSAAYFNNAFGCFAFTSNLVVLEQGIIQSPVIVQSGNSLFDPNLMPSPNITCQWSLNGVPIPGATQFTYIIPANGCYTLTIYESSCQSTSNTVCVTNTSIYEIDQNTIQIYPHPVNDVSVIATPFENGSESNLELFDVTGRQVRPASVQTGNSLTIEKGNLPKGIYFLKLSNSNYQGNVVRTLIFD